MRQNYFLAVLVFAALAGVLYFVWLVLVSVYRHWQLTKDVSAIKASNASRRREKEEASQKRLDNGCEHAFGESIGGLPPDTCRKCGLQRQRPRGPCDHIWELANEPVPCSYCKTCGKKYARSHAGQSANPSGL